MAAKRNQFHQADIPPAPASPHFAPSVISTPPQPVGSLSLGMDAVARAIRPILLGDKSRISYPL